MSNISLKNKFSLADQGLSMPEQGSAEWLAGRVGRITGSKGGDLFFDFKQESDWDKILAKWFEDTPQHFDELAKKRMAWGSKHEDTAVDVIVDSLPRARFFECPQILINDVYAVSPDGALIILDENGQHQEHLNIEIKCPGRYSKNGQEKSPEEMKQYLQKDWKFPKQYYMTQIHQEMVGQKCNETLFVAWSPEMTRMWRIPFNPSYWNLCLEVFENFRLKNIPFEVMHSKIDLLKRRSWGVANVPVWKDIYHDSCI